VERRCMGEGGEIIWFSVVINLVRQCGNQHDICRKKAILRVRIGARLR
jgi:hypothetical protein